MAIVSRSGLELSGFYDGRSIKKISIEDDALVIDLDTSYSIEIVDAGQQCCEQRYLTCDDDLPTYSGARIVSISVDDGPPSDFDGTGEGETMFVRITTDVGTIVVCTHNEHNGYYGGFSLQARVTDPNGNEVK